jgi:hypothetical protein
MAWVLILRHDFLAKPSLDMLSIIAGGLSKSEKGAQLFPVTTTTTAFQGIIKPSTHWNIKLFGHIIHGG